MTASALPTALSEEPDPPRRRRRWPRRLLLGAVVVLAVALAAAAWLAWRGLQARDALLAARPVVGQIEQRVRSGDADGARADLARLQSNSQEARDSTHDPVWDAAALLPLVGDDVRAVQQVTQVVDDVARRALPPLVDAAGSLDPAALQPVDGAIDLGPLREAAPRLQEADDAIQAAAGALAAVDTSGAVPQIAEPVDRLRDQIAEVAGTTATGARAAALLPGMLGADGPRSYLVLFQNNAEARATGGLPGAAAVVRADAGRITVEQQVSTSGIDDFDEPVLPLPAEFVALHTAKPGLFLQDVNFTPHFPTSAQLAREMWRRVTQQEVDGVLSVDPVALSYLLEATGPVRLLTGGEINADNAVELLLSRVYAQIAEPARQDAFFAAAATSVLGGLMSGSADPAALVEQLARAAGERRLLVWSADEREEGLLAGTVLEGSLPTGRDGHPAVGVYLNDGTAAKMGYYLRHDVTVSEVCGQRRPTYTVRVHLRSTAPLDAAATLPDYVLGGPAKRDLARGAVRTVVLVYGPQDGGILGMRLDGRPAPVATQTEQGWPVGGLQVDLQPGQEAVVEADVVALSGPPGLPVARTTPGVVAPEIARHFTDCGKS